MLKILSVLIVLSLSSSAFALTVNATHTQGFDKISVNAVQNCQYVMDPDGMDSSLIDVGLQSNPLTYNNTLLRIPVQSLPLQEGFSMTDVRGFKISYSQGVLHAQRTKSGESSANENNQMTLSVSPDLQRITSGVVQKLEGLIFKSPIAQMECQF